LKLLALLFLLSSLCLHAQSFRTPELSIEPSPTPGQVTVSCYLTRPQQVLLAKVDPIDFDQGRKLVDLRLVDAGGKSGPAIFASYRQEKDHLMLRPRYPLQAGQTYQATAYRPDQTTIQATYTVPPASPSEAPQVTRIYPTAEILPANCLKFYIYFSQPMREGRAIFDDLEMLNADGEVIEDAWRRTELWSKDARRLTLWIHPGRIKQGVNLREDYGPVLHPGRRYQLRISTRVTNMAGVHLEEAFVKDFRTREEDRTPPEPNRWRRSQPKAGSREPLQITFDDALDHAQLPRFLTVRQDAKPFTGTLVVEPGETACTFTPDDPWPTSGCDLIVNGRLEDLAGNTPLRVFDTDLQDPARRPPNLALPIKNL
jgi:hypothetical protein